VINARGDKSLSNGVPLFNFPKLFLECRRGVHAEHQRDQSGPAQAVLAAVQFDAGAAGRAAAC